MDEMLPIVAAEAESKSVNGAKLKPEATNQQVLTSLVVSDTEVRRGQVDVHVVLEDLLEEALPLPYFELLGHVHLWKPLAALTLRWRSTQEGATGLI